MKVSSIVELVLANAIILYLVALVRSDQASRLDYWRLIGFSPSTVYSAFTLRYPAVNGSTSIPGLPTLDWVQVLLAVLVLTDIYYVASELDNWRRRGARVDGVATTPSSESPQPMN